MPSRPPPSAPRQRRPQPTAPRTPSKSSRCEITVSAAKERVKKARAGAYREIVLRAAERIFAEAGYAGAKMQDIAAEAGLALATVYGAVGGKDELYGAIHAERGQALLAAAAERSARASSPRQALCLGVEAYVAFLAEHPHYLRIHLKESQPWALSPRFTTEIQRRQWREGLALTVAVFRAGIADGTFLEEDPQRMARLMIAAHQVFLVDWVEGGMQESPSELSARMIAHLERAFLRQGFDSGESLPAASMRRP